jgi:hypothetical protein
MTDWPFRLLSLTLDSFGSVRRHSLGGTVKSVGQSASVGRRRPKAELLCQPWSCQLLCVVLSG